ncbi:multifunctional oxoglutarate decarboxylase/oxoglutarate dehydrogenase thiamine pyrophosphate-binding subunit/dihydrolipoyllysine-residue succinyltransferase subunit, partial [Nocardia sp. NPDC004260]
EQGIGDRSKVKRILMTSGKLYYELAAEKAKQKREDVAILRVEQLYPLPTRRLNEALEGYPNATDLAWVQEEPANQGAWPFFGLNLPETLPARFANTKLRRISRRAMSAPSSGSSKVHAVEQAEIIAESFEPTA